MRFLPLLLAVLLLPACGGGAGMGGALPVIDEKTSEAGDSSLALDPLDVWGDGDAGNQEAHTLDGDDELIVRVREKEWLEHASVRLGLYWDSRRNARVYLPVVIAGGPPVELRAAYFQTDGNKVPLQLAGRDFRFKPVKRMLDREDRLYSGAFILPADALGRVAGAKDVWVSLQTNRGELRVNLAVVTGRDKADLRNSGKYQFAEFYRRMQARL